MKQPLVSIVIPTYNRPLLLKKALENILKQSYQDFEVIVINDGGSDETEKIIKKLNDPRIFYYKKNHEGVSKTRNFGIKKTRGKYIAFCDDDDVWLPEKLKIQIDFLEKNNNVALCYCQYFRWEKKQWEMFPTKISTKIEDLLFLNIIATPTVVIRKNCLDMVGYFNPNLKVAEDYDMWLRIGSKFRIAVIQKPLVRLMTNNEYRLSKDLKNLGINANQSAKRTLTYLIDTNYSLSPLLIKKLKSLFLFRDGKIDFFERKYFHSFKKFLYAIKIFPLNYEAWLFIPFCFLGVNFFEKLIPVYEKILKRKYLKYY